MRNRVHIVFAAFIVALMAAGCPILRPDPGPTDPVGGEAFLLQYKYPQGRILRYRTTSKTLMRYTMPFISDIQQVRSETVVDVLEEVLQEPIGGYAIIEQKVGSMTFRLFNGNRLIFDSTHPGDFPPHPRLDNLTRMRGTSIRYEINGSGDIRHAEGLEDMADIMGSGTMSRIFQGAQPVLPAGPVSPGETWQSEHEVPLTPGRGYEGLMQITDKSKLLEIKRENGVQTAVFELKRELKMRMHAAGKSGKRKKDAVKGDAKIHATITFDIERGIVISNNGRMDITTTTAVSDQPFASDLIMEIKGLYNTVLIERDD